MLKWDELEQAILNSQDSAADALIRRQRAARLYDRIRSHLTPRQVRIYRLHSQRKSFTEIAFMLQCSPRVVRAEWKTIRALAWRYALLDD